MGGPGSKLLLLGSRAGELAALSAISAKEAGLSPVMFDMDGSLAKWPDPDSYSELLESLQAARGEPISERFSERFFEMKGSGQYVTVQLLGGGKLQLTRPQLRAMVSVYS